MGVAVFTNYHEKNVPIQNITAIYMGRGGEGIKLGPIPEKNYWDQRYCTGTINSTAQGPIASIG